MNRCHLFNLCPTSANLRCHLPSNTLVLPSSLTSYPLPASLFQRVSPSQLLWNVLLVVDSSPPIHSPPWALEELSVEAKGTGGLLQILRYIVYQYHHFTTHAYTNCCLYLLVLCLPTFTLTTININDIITLNVACWLWLCRSMRL